MKASLTNAFKAVADTAQSFAAKAVQPKVLKTAGGIALAAALSGCVVAPGYGYGGYGYGRPYYHHYHRGW